MEERNSIDFVAKHYRHGMFAVKPALRRIKGINGSWWSRTRVAAAVTIFIVVTASAAVFVRYNYLSPRDASVDTPAAVQAPAQIVRVIDFEAAPLPAVVSKIHEVYGVDIVNLPENVTDYSLSLHYEGSAADLIETINDLLGTEMKIAE